MTISLIQFFKQSPQLDTDVGSFTYVSSLGQGGNAYVLKFKRGEHEFAIKFIPHDKEGKLQRFRDEFFCAAQIPTHNNVVASYHFDTKKINEIDYSLIVMKAYDKTLNAIGHVANKEELEKNTLAWKLFIDLCKGISHLHSHHIIHRDIKPQNIFFDQKADSFVIGDLGIAHFKAEAFAKEADTKSSERLANFSFSAPEQVNSKNEITEAADIYSLGQVMQWYLTGTPVRGQGRTSFAGKTPQDKLSIIDEFTKKALRDKPSERFQSFKEIASFVNDAKKEPERDPLIKIDDFDDVIRRSFPEITNKVNITNLKEISEFLENFKNQCNLSEFWYVMADGGDNHLVSIDKMENETFLFNGVVEMSIKNLLIYRDGHHDYKNFFILLFGPEDNFIYSDEFGNKINRPSTAGWEYDYAKLVDDQFYIDPSKTKNGYYRMNGQVIGASRDRFKDRQRYLVPYGLIIVPTQTASASMTDRAPTSNLIKAAIRDKDLKENELTTYLNATRNYHSDKITMWN